MLRTDLLQQIKTGHGLHVQVGDHKLKACSPHSIERRDAVVNVIDMLEAGALEHLDNYETHRAKVFDHKNGQ
jgi:hypothetical protein